MLSRLVATSRAFTCHGDFACFRGVVATSRVFRSHGNFACFRESWAKIRVRERLWYFRVLVLITTGSDKWGLCSKNHAANGVRHRPRTPPPFFRRQKGAHGGAGQVNTRVLFYVPWPFRTGGRDPLCETTLCGGCHVYERTPDGFLFSVYVDLAPSDLYHGVRCTQNTWPHKTPDVCRKLTKQKNKSCEIEDVVEAHLHELCVICQVEGCKDIMVLIRRCVRTLDYLAGGPSEPRGKA